MSILCQEKTFHGHLVPSRTTMTFYDLLLPSMNFYDLLWPSIIKSWSNARTSLNLTQAQSTLTEIFDYLCKPLHFRYQTEGSRGAIKDKSGSSFPSVKLEGYNKPARIQIFIGTDSGKISPHLFYQVQGLCTYFLKIFFYQLKKRLI